jgi:hypothetical protein
VNSINIIFVILVMSSRMFKPVISCHDRWLKWRKWIMSASSIPPTLLVAPFPFLRL